jgi:two-component system, OmpR family, response regulator
LPGGRCGYFLFQFTIYFFTWGIKPWKVAMPDRNAAQTKVLLIEDEHKIADFVCAGLSACGFEVTHCDNGNTGLLQACQSNFDAVILDLMLPGRDGLSVLREMRSRGVNTPVILLTARNELGDRIEGLGLGADDYLAKPFFVEELVARIQALLRRLAGDRQNTLQAGSLKLDRISRQASCSGQTIELTTREFSLLEYLMRSAGQVFSRRQILEHVWGYDFDPSTNVVDVCIKRIRGKLAGLQERDEAAFAIESVRGTGYRFKQI